MAKMPPAMEELLNKLDNPEDVRHIQQRWNECVAANDKYELAFPEQFGNLVESNRRFGENKTIPTPAEQLRMYETMVTQEINDLAEIRQHEQEELYELEEQQPQQNAQLPSEERMRDFQLTFDDMGYTEQEEKTPQQEPQARGRDLDQSQDLSVTWLKEYQAQQEAVQGVEQEQPTTKEEPAKPYDFNLVFKGIEEMEKEDAIEPEMEQEREDMDMEYE